MKTTILFALDLKTDEILISESEIQEQVFDYYRNETWESNKKYADMLRRGLAKGYYKRFLWKRKSDSKNLYRYYVPTSVKENFLKNN